MRFSSLGGCEIILKDYKALWKACIITLAITAVWYGVEFMQYGTLQWDRQCDNVVGAIYFFVLWDAYHKNNNFISEIVNICKSKNKHKVEEK